MWHSQSIYLNTAEHLMEILESFYIIRWFSLPQSSKHKMRAFLFKRSKTERLLLGALKLIWKHMSALSFSNHWASLISSALVGSLSLYLKTVINLVTSQSQLPLHSFANKTWHIETAHTITECSKTLLYLLTSYDGHIQQVSAEFL